MTDLLLKAKHWQLFLLLFGIPILFQFVMMGSIITNVVGDQNPDMAAVFSYMQFFPVVMIIVSTIFFGWFWAVAVGLQKKIPDTVKMNVGKFKVFFFIPLVYILLISVFMGGTINGAFESAAKGNAGMIGTLAALVVPLHLFFMFCIFYSLYFAAKTFKTVELQREVKFSDFAGEFFMIWFYPIGIWIIQPKINKMAEDQ